MAYAVEVPRRVRKQVARLPNNIRDRSYRIVYEIDDEGARVLVLEIWHRQRDYR